MGYKKRGRKPREESEIRRHKRTIRLTDEQDEALMVFATELKMTPSTALYALLSADLKRIEEENKGGIYDEDDFEDW